MRIEREEVIGNMGRATSKARPGKAKQPRATSAEGRRTVEFGEQLVRLIEARRKKEGFTNFSEFLRHVSRQYLTQKA